MTKFLALRGAVLILCFASLWLPTLRGQTQTGSSGGGSTFSANAPVPVETGQNVGAGIFGTLPFKLTINVSGGYDDNFTTSNQLKQASPFTNAGALAEYDFGDSRTRINFSLGVDFTYYYDYIAIPGIASNDYDINIPLRLSLIYKSTPRFTFAADIFLTYTSEPDFTIAQGLNQRAGNYFFTQDKFTGTYLWSPRFATATSYTFGTLRYDDDQLGFFENRWENTFGNEFRFLLSRTTTFVAEYRFQLFTYQDADRDSRTQYALGGFDHTFDPRLSMSIRGGAQFREFDPNGSETGPYVEANFNYAAGKQTTIAWTNRYGLEEPDNAFSQSRQTFRTGLSGKHDFTSRISATLGAYYEHNDYQSINQPGFFTPGFTEQVIDLSVGLRYAVARYWGVEVGYGYTDVWGDIAGREYTRNRVWAGVNVTF
jgi:hypothetical protein